MPGETLFAGDIIFEEKDGLKPLPSHFSSDPEKAIRGIFKLEALDFEIHLSNGDDILTVGKEKLAELLIHLRNGLRWQPHQLLKRQWR